MAACIPPTVIADCRPNVGPAPSRLAHLELSNEECQTLEQLHFPMIALLLDHSTGQVVSNASRANRISIRIVEAGPSYDPLARFEGVTPVREEKGMKIYGKGNDVEYRLTGSDGNELVIAGILKTWVAYRAYKEFAIDYQYTGTPEDFKPMDDAVIHLMERMFPNMQNITPAPSQ